MIDKNPQKKSVDPAPGTKETKSLRHKFISSSMWVILGHALSQVIRLGGNLILTRLLFPEAFGLMALVNVFLLGVNSFSDIGLRGSIVHNPRGDEEAFLNTAWTIQIVRGVIMWVMLCLCAWPASVFYNAPQLVQLIPVVGLIAIIQGCASTSLFTLVRQISLRRKMIQDIGSQVVGLVIMVICALIWKSVWALVAGSLFRVIFLTAWSHFLIPGYRNRIQFDREAARAILHFGKWIFISTALTFLGAQGDRLVLGKIFNSEELGVYSIAFFLSQAIVIACQALSGNVLFPVYTQLAKQGLSALRGRMVKIRVSLMLFTLPPTCVLAIFGQQIVEFFYDARYVEAGWMLQILAIRAIAQTVNVSTERVLLAFGDSYRHMILQLSRVILMIMGMYAGHLFAGIQGLLIGMAAASFVEYFVMAGLINRYGAWMPRIDAQAFALSGVIILLGIYFI